MNKDYNGRLKPMHNKGLCGDPEIVESSKTLDKNVSKLATLIKKSQRVVIFTGAGISTSCGIPDFRGPNGVWTKEKMGTSIDPMAEQINTFDQAQPSFAHFAIACLLHAGAITHVVSQNVDGLHLKSGVPEEHLSELHGNIFKEKCEACGTEYLRDHDVGGMGLNYTGKKCERPGCTGRLRDMAIDWDTDLPGEIFSRAHKEMDSADLVITMGTSLRIQPAGNMPLRVTTPKVRRGGRTGKLCIINLQKTHLDKKATIRISHYCDDVMSKLCKLLGVTLKEKSELNGANIPHCYTIAKSSPLLARPRTNETAAVLIPEKSKKSSLPSASSGKATSESSKPRAAERRKLSQKKISEVEIRKLATADEVDEVDEEVAVITQVEFDQLSSNKKRKVHS